MKQVVFSPAENDIIFFARQHMISNLLCESDISITVIETDSYKEEYLKDSFGKKINVYDFSPKNKNFDIAINLCFDRYFNFIKSDVTHNFIEIGDGCFCPTDWSKLICECIFKNKNELNLIDSFNMAYKKIFGIDAVKKNWIDLNHSSFLRRSKYALNGIAVRDDQIRSYIKNKFFYDDNRLWHIPIKKDINKRFFEINACENVITDDLFYVMASLILGKKVVFLSNDFSYSIKDNNVEMIKVSLNE